jgi:hypothetical protein
MAKSEHCLFLIFSQIAVQLYEIRIEFYGNLYYFYNYIFPGKIIYFDGCWLSTVQLWHEPPHASFYCKPNINVNSDRIDSSEREEAEINILKRLCKYK